MQTLQLVATAQDDVIAELQQIIQNFIKSKPTAKIKKLQTEPQIDTNNDSLSGMFSHYVTHRLSDEEIADGIAQGAYERAMKGLNHD